MLSENYMKSDNNVNKKIYSEQRWIIKNNIATCLDDDSVCSLRTIDITANEDKEICVLIIKNLLENQNQLYKGILKITPALMEMIFKENYRFYWESNPNIPKSEITRYFLSQTDKWFLFVEEIKKIASEAVLMFGGLIINIGARAEFPVFEIVDKLDRDNNIYIMIIGRYCKVPTLVKSHAVVDELNFLHDSIGLTKLKDPKKENLLLIRNSYNNLLNRHGHFIGLTNKTLETSLISIYHWVQPFEINLQMLSDVADFERDMCNNCLIALKDVQEIYTNILCRSFYCENDKIDMNSFLSKESYNPNPHKKHVIDIFISKLKEKVENISEIWNIPQHEISLDFIIDSLPWALQIEMLVYFTKEQKRYFWNYYVECNKLENNVIFEDNLFDNGFPYLPLIFSFLKDMRNICAHSGILMQSLILPSASYGILNYDDYNSIVASNNRLKINELIIFRNKFQDSKDFVRILKKYNLNINWIYEEKVESTWPALMNFTLLLPFLVSQTVYARWCKNTSEMIKSFFLKICQYERNPNIDVINWKETCLTYTKNICLYLGIDLLIDDDYLLGLDLE